MIYGINIIRKKHNNMFIFLTIYIYTIYIYSYIQLLVVILSIRLVSANLFGGLCWPDELAGSTVTHTVNLVNSTQANLQTMRPHVIICYNVINILFYIRNLIRIHYTGHTTTKKNSTIRLIKSSPWKITMFNR